MVVRMALADKLGVADVGRKKSHSSLPQHCLYFFPEPQGQVALRPVVSMEKLGLRLGMLSLSVVPAGEGIAVGSMLDELPETPMLS